MLSVIEREGKIYMSDTGVVERNETFVKKMLYSEGLNEMSIYNEIYHPNILKPISATATLEVEYDGYKPYIYLITPKMQNIDSDFIVDNDNEIKWFTDMVSALSYLNHLDISHNDIKMDNMLYDPITDNYLLFDFGYASIGNKCLQSKSGTVTTMSPEVFYNEYYKGNDKVRKVISYKSDVYSLGIVLYEVITGVSPLYSEDLSNDQMLLLRRDREWLQEVEDNKSYRLIEWMTRYDPDSRPSFIQLSEMLGNVTIHQRLQTLSYQIDDIDLLEHIDRVFRSVNEYDNARLITETFITQAKKIIGNYVSKVPKLDHFEQLLLIFNSISIVIDLCYQDPWIPIPYDWIYFYAKEVDVNYYGLTEPQQLINKFNGWTELGKDKHMINVYGDDMSHFDYLPVVKSLVDISNVIEFKVY